MLWYWHILVQDVNGKLWDFNGRSGHQKKSEASDAANDALKDGTILDTLRYQGCPQPEDVAVIAVDAILQ